MSRVLAKRRKIRQIKLFVTLVLVIFTLLVLSTFVFGQNDIKALEVPVEKSYESVVIYYGDTVWSLAEAHYDPVYYDVDSYVEEILSINNMDNTYIKAGHSILVPVVIK